jgi:hypothetical protein
MPSSRDKVSTTSVDAVPTPADEGINVPMSQISSTPAKPLGGSSSGDVAESRADSLMRIYRTSDRGTRQDRDAGVHAPPNPIGYETSLPTPGAPRGRQVLGWLSRIYGRSRAGSQYLDERILKPGFDFVTIGGLKA